MREILFKGKRLDNGEWVQGWYYQLRQNEKEITHYIVESPLPKLRGVKEHRIYAETVCQYTGLKDKNGKKIFEGDIVKFGDSVKMDKTGDVKFTAGAFMPVINGIGYTSWHIVCEIIGNIHDKE